MRFSFFDWKWSGDGHVHFYDDSGRGLDINPLRSEKTWISIKVEHEDCEVIASRPIG